MPPSLARDSLVLTLLSLGTLGCETSPCGPELWQTCDIRDVACQHRIFDAVRCDRGYVSGGYPPVRVIDRETFRAELEASASASEPDPHTDATLQLLDLAPDGVSSLETSIDVTVASTSAFYRREEQDVTIIDRGAPMNLQDDATTLAHEMVHVVQDRLYGIDSVFDGATTIDESFARSAVVEGDATHFSLVYAARAAGGDIEDVRWESIYAAWLRDLLADAHDHPAPFRVAMGSLRYALGARAMWDRWRDFPRTAGDDLWSEPPTSSLSLMFDLGSGVAPIASPRAVRCATPAPPPGLEQVDEDSFGPIAVYAFLGSSGLSSDDAWDLARRIVGDRIVAFGDDSGTVTAFQWRIRASTPSFRVVLEDAITGWASAAGVLLASDRDEIVLAGATDAGVLAGWSDAIAGCE